MGPQPGAFLADLPLQPDQRRQEEGESEFLGLQQALTGQFAERQHPVALPIRLPDR
jgi:hypothetical protein